MVQTKDGATENPWITYMRTCAANYRAGLPVEAYPRKVSQSERESPCTCQSSQMVSPPSHAKRKRGTEASASEPSKKEQKQEVDTAIRKEKSQAQKMKKESAKGLLSTETQTQTTRKNKVGRQSITLKEASSRQGGTLDDYAHATARALEKVRIERGERRK